MSGRRHHILPQFLLKNFASSPQKSVSQVWVYRRNKPPFFSNILNVAVEADFYGKPEHSSADDRVTVQEGDFAPVVESLLKVQPGPVSDSESIGPLIAHLSARTKNLRMAVGEASQGLMKEMHLYLQTPGLYVKLIENQLKKPEVIGEQIQKIGIPPTKEIIAAFQAFLPSVLLKEESNIMGILNLFFDEMFKASASISSNSQMKSLETYARETPKAELFNVLNWRVVPMEGSLILGDSGCLFKQADTEKFQPYPDSPKKVEHVLLPISSHRLLFGYLEDENVPLSCEEINWVSARCSREFYCSSLSENEHGRYTDSIGDTAVFFSRETIKKTVDEAMAKILSDR